MERGGGAAAADDRRGRGAHRSSRARPAASAPSDDFNSGGVIVFLKPWEERDRDDRRAWSARSTAALGQMPAVRGNAAVAHLAEPRPRPADQFRDRRRDLCRAGRARATASSPPRANNPGIVNLDSDYKETKPQLRIEVDTARAGDLGVSVADVIQGAADAARLAPGLDLCRPRRGISRDRPGRATGPRDRDQSRRRSMCAAAPARWCRCPTWSARAKRPARATSAATTSCARSRSAAASRPAIRSARRSTFLEEQAAAARPRSPRSAIAARARRSARRADRSISSSLLTILVVYLLLAAQFESFVHPGGDHHHRAARGRRRR